MIHRRSNNGSILMKPDGPKLYSKLASWFHILTAPRDYAEEAEFARGLLSPSIDSSNVSVLELGCGGGNNASHLKAHFTMTPVSYTHLRAHETGRNLVCRLLLEKKKKK